MEMTPLRSRDNNQLRVSYHVIQTVMLNDVGKKITYHMSELRGIEIVWMHGFTQAYKDLCVGFRHWQVSFLV